MNNVYQYGDKLVGYAGLESTYGVPPTITAGMGFRAITLRMQQSPDRVPVPDRRGTRSRMQTIQGRPFATWGATAILRPSGSLGVAPDIGPLLTMALGQEAVVADTSVTYSLLRDMSGIHGFVLKQLTSMHEFVRGAIVQSWTLSWDGRGFIQFECSGIAKAFGRTGKTQTNGTGTASAALVVDDADQLSVYSIVQVDGDATQHIVTALTHSTETATLAATTSWGDDKDVEAYLPAATFVGDANPLYGTKASLSLDGGSTTVKHLRGSLSGTTGADLNNEESGSDSPTDVIMQDSLREIKLSLDFLVRREDAHLYSEYRRKIAKDVLLTFGDEAGKRFKARMQNVEFDDGQFDTPNSGPSRVTIAGDALGVSAGEDELTLTKD